MFWYLSFRIELKEKLLGTPKTHDVETVDWEAEVAHRAAHDVWYIEPRPAAHHAR
jgi:hypothetical protein